MRDYDPTTGRYLQADPLGLVDGASVYGYAGQSPGRWVDPRGLFTLRDAENSLRSSSGGRRPFPTNAIYDEWLRLERLHKGWLKELAPCPCTVDNPDVNIWQPPVFKSGGVPYHPGGYYDLRQNLTPGGHGSQCIYDQNGNIILSAPGAGTADFSGFTGLDDLIGAYSHYQHDVEPYYSAIELGRINDYYEVRPVTP